MDAAAEFKAALAAQLAGRAAEAEAGYRAILARGDHLASMHNLAVVLESVGRFEEAGEVYRRAVAAAPGRPAPLRALATHCRVTRQLAEAEAAYRAYLALAPDDEDAALGLAAVVLAQGRYAEGWPLYEARGARQHLLKQPLSFPEWRGEPLAGKRLLIWREQGFGDQIMMARFLARLGAGAVTYLGLPQLRRLFEPLPVSFVEARPQMNDVAPHDYWTLPCSLPHWLGVTGETLPSAPYLFGTARRTGARIGVVTRGEATNANDAFRSLPQAQAAELLALPGAISLDPADTGAADFQASADLIAGLDLVITVDTAVAHLAGAMGRPVWVLLARHAIDWQWPRTERTPWYPSARLFTQATPGDWASVVAGVSEQARRLTAS